MMTFESLKVWFDSMPDQRMGRAASLCETGDTYTEFFAKGLARPGDEMVVEVEVAEQMYRTLVSHFANKRGRIYIRIPLEWEIKPHSVVVRLDENGPDIDFTTNEKCVMDHNWRRVACYCRLFRAAEPAAEAA